jgi:hypothetical protein
MHICMELPDLAWIESIKQKTVSSCASCRLPAPDCSYSAIQSPPSLALCMQVSLSLRINSARDHLVRLPHETGPPSEPPRLHTCQSTALPLTGYCLCIFPRVRNVTGPIISQWKASHSASKQITMWKHESIHKINLNQEWLFLHL